MKLLLLGMIARVGKNIFSLALSRIISGVVLFFVYVKLAEYLGPSGFGKFSLVLAYYTIFLTFVDLGISRYAVKKISEDRGVAAQYLGNFFIAQFFIAVIVLAAFVFLPKFLHYDFEVSRAMIYTGVGLFLAAMSIPFAAIVQAWQKIHLLALVYMLDSFIRAAWFIWAIVAGKGIVFIFAVFIFNGVFDIIIYLAVTGKIVRPHFSLDIALTKKLFLYGFPFAFISGFEILISKIGLVIQKVFLPFSEVGLYAAASRILDFLTFIPAIIAISLFPYFAETTDLRAEETSGVIDRLNRYMVMLALPLGVGGTMFADKIIVSLFGLSFTGSIVLFQILIWSTVITFVYAVPNVIMQVRKTKTAVLILAGAAILNAAANYVLIPRFGILASAWLTAITYLLVAVFYVWRAGKLAQQFFLLRHALWPALATAVMAIILWPVRHLHIFLITLIALTVYFGLLFVVGFLKREDYLFLGSIFTKSK